jgi:uncharacterized protein
VTALRLKTAVVIYGALAALAVGLGFARGNPDIFNHPDGFLSERLPLWARVLAGLALGISFGIFVARLTRYSVYRFEWAKSLHTEFRGLFGPLRNIDIIAYAGLSAAAEEIFFRGAVQQALGIVAAGLIFGALHIGPGKKFLPWPVQASVMGFAFGGLYWLTGDLIAPTVAHFTVNYQNLHFINRYDPVIKLPRSLIGAASEEHARN